MSPGDGSKRIGIVLSGWAPAMTLMSGAMLGFVDRGVRFDVISTSGIGGLIGLLSVAPRGKSPEAALRELPNLYMSDFLYRFVPLNPKVFFKYGPFGELAYTFRKGLPRLDVDPLSPSPLARILNDSVDLAVSAMTPSTLGPESKGLMSHVSMIEDLVDFGGLEAALGNRRFYLSAFDVAQKAVEVFGARHIAENAYRAAQCMFLLFPPEPVDTQFYTTGATHDPTGLQAIWLHERDTLDMVVALDPLSEAIWREPQNIHDALQLMFLNPVVALQSLVLDLYAKTEHALNTSGAGTPPVRLPRLYRIPLDIPPAYYPDMLRWTHDNAVTLERLGYEAATAFADALHAGADDTVERFRGEHLARRGPSVDLVRVVDERTRIFEPAFRESCRANSRARGGRRAPPVAGQPTAAPRAARDTMPGEHPAPRLGILVGGGAPNLHLAAGALCAFHEHGVRFDLIGAAGAGALPALLYAVPRGGDPVASLKATVDINIHDAINAVLPYNFKVFFKRGPFAEPFWRLGRLLPRFALTPDDRYRDTWRRLYNDCVDLAVAAVTPTTLWYGSPSVCTRLSVVDDLVDWDGLPDYPNDFYLNAFDLGAQKLQLFDKGNLTPAAFYAALALPWLYEPTVAGARTYTEGAAHDPSCLGALLLHDKLDVDVLIAMDTIGPDLWIDPSNIHEALELAVIDSIISLDEYLLAFYAMQEVAEDRRPRLYSLEFEIDKAYASRILDWSHSNALHLWDVGHRAGEQFCRALPSGDGEPARDSLETYRYYAKHSGKPHIRKFLSLFEPLPAAAEEIPS